MKSRFLGTTAIATSILLATSGAQAADKIEVGLGGYFNAFLVHANQDDGTGEPGANRRDHMIAREGEIFFKGKTTLDNGITIGVDVQLEAETCGDQIDESFIYVQGGFGKLVVGADDPASDAMYFGTPQPIAGVGVATPDDVFSALGNAVATPTSITSISGDSEKITYFTPRLSGFQMGFSYTPENCEEANAPCAGTYSGMPLSNSAGQQSEIIEVGANYIRKIGGVDMGLYAGIGRGDLELAAAGVEDQDQWGLGVELGVGGFTIGADYREDDQGTSGANTDRTDYSVGVTYALGSWTLGAAYAHGKVEAGAGLGEDETDGYQAGVVYDVGPGIVVTGGITYWDVQDNLNAVGIENESTEFIIGTLLSF